MSDLPWFQFFPSDWLAGTRGLSAIESGVYITLIATMYDHGAPLKEDTCRLAKICGATVRQFTQALETLVDGGKILRTEEGLWNARVDQECKKRVQKSALAKRAAEISHKKRKENQCEVSADAVQTQSGRTANQKPEPEPEDSGMVEAPARRDLETRLREAAGWQDEPSPKLFITGPIQALIDAGADLESDVLPTVRAIAPQAASRTSWKYFLAAIARARDDRIAASKIVSINSQRPTHETARPRNSRADNLAVVHAIIDEAERRENEAGGCGAGVDSAGQGGPGDGNPGMDGSDNGNAVLSHGRGTWLDFTPARRLGDDLQVSPQCGGHSRIHPGETGESRAVQARS